MLDRLNPTIEELSTAVEQEAKQRPEVLRLMTHPGVGPLTALAFVLIIDSAKRFACGKQIGSYLGLIPCEDSSANRAAGAYQQAGQHAVTFLAGGSSPGSGPARPRLATRRRTMNNGKVALSTQPSKCFSVSRQKADLHGIRL